MTAISDAFLKIQIGANLKPDGLLTGSIAAGFSAESKPAPGTLRHVLTARVIFSLPGQTASFSAFDGTHTLSAAGTAQVEQAVVTAAAGATGNGNLELTLTGARVIGSPLAINVPLTIYNHGTAALIAAAIADKLNATPGFSLNFTAAAKDVSVFLESKFGFALDTTLNLAIAAGLGVTAAASSFNSKAGVAGVIVQRAGGSGKDAFGAPWGTGVQHFMETAVRCTEAQNSWVSAAWMGDLFPGEAHAAIAKVEPLTLSFTGRNGPAIMEVTAFAV